MPGLVFQDAAPSDVVAPNRADIACFIGYVSRRATALSPDLKDWLYAQGWREPGIPIDDNDPLLHTPVPVESFEAFDQLFAWEARPANTAGQVFPTWLGAAVRSYFTQGGARCFIVRTGDPWAYEGQPSDAATRKARLDTLLPGLTGAEPGRDRRETWKGLAVLHGLDAAALVCLPDLPEISADATLDPAGLPEPPVPEEVFVPVAIEPPLPPIDTRQISPSPACTEAGYRGWYRVANFASGFLRRHRRDVQLMLALPLPAPGTTPEGDLLRLLDDPSGMSGLGARADSEISGIATAFLQLVYPWLETDDSDVLPGGLIPPDGTLAGVAARSIVNRGAYRSLGRQTVNGVLSFSPPLPARDLQLATPPQGRPALIHRVSLLGPTPDGPRVLSDVTTSLDTPHRPASVGRLTAAILRAASRIGDDFTFDPADTTLRGRIVNRLNRLLADFYRAGALAGAGPADAYSVRCDDTTTTPNDEDNGRLLAEVRFAPSYPVGLITVVLALRESGVTAAGAA